jgi:hypothetical protein
MTAGDQRLEPSRRWRRHGRGAGGEQRERSDPGRGMPGVPGGQGRVRSCRDLPSTCRSFRGLSWWPVQRGNGGLQERPIPGSVSVEVQVPLQIGSFPQVPFCHPDSRPCTKSHPGFLPGRSIRGNPEGYRRVMCGGLPCAAGCLGSASGTGWSRGNPEGYRRVMCGGLPCAAGCLGSASGTGWSRGCRGFPQESPVSVTPPPPRGS